MRGCKRIGFVVGVEMVVGPSDRLRKDRVRCRCLEGCWSGRQATIGSRMRLLLVGWTGNDSAECRRLDVLVRLLEESDEMVTLVLICTGR